MTTCNPSDRFTSKDILVQFMPCGSTEQIHIQHFYFHNDITAGTFKLRVNGEETAAITYSATEATLITSVNSALDALSNTVAGELVFAGASTSDMTITSDTDDGKKFYIITVDGSLLIGNVTDEPNVTTLVTQQGTTLYTISTQFSSFGYEESVDTVEVTSIAEYEATEIPVKSTMSWNASIYEANEAWKFAVFAGQSGIMHVYPRGKFVGMPYMVFRALIETASTEFPDHDVVETTLDGQRQGAMIVPINSIYKG